VSGLFVAMFAGGALIGVGVPVLVLALAKGGADRHPAPAPIPAPAPAPGAGGPTVTGPSTDTGTGAGAPDVPTPPGPALARRLEALRKRSKRAVDDYAEIRADLAAFISDAEGRPERGDAERLLEEIDSRYDDAAKAALDEAREAARALVARGDHSAAASGLRSVEARFGESRWLRTAGREGLAGELARVEELRRRAAADLVKNGGFESGGRNWDNWAAMAVVRDAPRSGGASMRIGPKQGGAGQAIGSVRPGDRLVFRAWARVSKKGEVGWVGVDFFDAADKKDSRSIELTNTAYEEKTRTVTVPPNMARTAVWAWKNDGVGGFLYVDDYSLEKVED
jgi:hypothetical protein